MKAKINYSQCWEDIDLLRKALQINQADIIFSITSGGDNSLSLLLDEPAKVIALDVNPVQNFLAELKIKAAIYLSYTEYLELLGVTPSNRRIQLFQAVKPHLSSNTAAWWQNHAALLAKGLIHIGKLETFLNIFRKFLLPLVHSQHEITTLLNMPTLEEQTVYYHSVWNSWRWKIFFKLASNPLTLKKLARQDIMANQDYHRSKETYQARLEQLILRVPLPHNYYMHYCLRGTYGEYLPPYLTKQGYQAIRGLRPRQLEFVTKDMLSYLQSMSSDTFSKFNLSDALESLSEKENHLVWQEIVRVAKNKAKIVHWSHQLTRLPPPTLVHQITSHPIMTKKIHASDRIFFYKSFHIHTVNK